MPRENAEASHPLVPVSCVTLIAAWLCLSLPASCLSLGHCRAVKQCQVGSLWRGGALDVKQLSWLASCFFSLALALFVHPGPLLSARG